MGDRSGDEREISASGTSNRWPIFICYRQSDGTAAAGRVYELLHDRKVPLGDDDESRSHQPTLDVYFDQAAPGVEDWTALHEPHLKRARAIIVVCTPGAKLNEGPNDWVHREIDWWLEHRQLAPILVDPLGEDARYVPGSIAARWPNAQRITLIDRDWENLSAEERRSLDERVRERFLGAIVPSGESFYRQEIAQEQERAARLRRFVWTAIGLSVASFVLLVLAAVATTQWQAAEEARVEADVARERAEAAEQLANSRVREGQAARAQTEAGVLDILLRFRRDGPYADTIEEWADDFRSRAAVLTGDASTDQSVCERVGSFGVDEGQMVRIRLSDDAEAKAMFAYLAVVPASGTSGLTPAVLDVFFAEPEDVTRGRGLVRKDVRAQMDSVAPDAQWSLLVGLATPQVLTRDDRNYRLSHTGTYMDDGGDMRMTFEVCRETPLAGG